jgi:hypothetical protein
VKTRRLAWGSDTVHAGSRPETHHTSNKEISHPRARSTGMKHPLVPYGPCCMPTTHLRLSRGEGGRTVGAGAEVDVRRRTEGQHSHHGVVERAVLVRTDTLPVPVLVQQDVVRRLIRGEDACGRGAARSEG